MEKVGTDDAEVIKKKCLIMNTFMVINLKICSNLIYFQGTRT